MLGAPDSRIVTGEGLGPDLRALVPFTMVRREGKSARFVALHAPYTDGLPVMEFRAVSDTVYEVGKDRISIAAGKFSVSR